MTFAKVCTRVSLPGCSAKLFVTEENPQTSAAENSKLFRGKSRWHDGIIWVSPRNQLRRKLDWVAPAKLSVTFQKFVKARSAWICSSVLENRREFRLANSILYRTAHQLA